MKELVLIPTVFVAGWIMQELVRLSSAVSYDIKTHGSLRPQTADALFSLMLVALGGILGVKIVEAVYKE